MGSIDRRIDAYIVRSADFAIPILEFLRECIHEGCPEAKETMKWSFPHFDYKQSILCSMASFKGHCAFGFWPGSKMKDPDGIFEKGERSSMGQLGRITSLDDLPSKKVLIKYIREAMKLIDGGFKIERKLPEAKEKKSLKVPADLNSALKKNLEAQEQFRSFSYSRKKEYVEWILGAKTEATRSKRIVTAVEWIGQGKSLNWKYQR